MTPAEAPSYQPGRTFLKLDGGTLYCAAWNNVFALDIAKTAISPLASGATQIFGITPTTQGVYYLDGDDADRNFWQVTANGTEKRGSADFGGISELSFDAPRNRILWAPLGGLVAYSLDSDTWSILAREAAGESAALDDKFVYWARYSASTDWSSIERLALATN